MTTPDEKQTGNNSKELELDKTIKLQRCPEHGLAFMPKEGCPECQKKQHASAERAQ